MPFFWQPDGSNFYKFFQRLGLRLYGATSGAVGITPPAVAGSTDYTLPGSAPSSNGQSLVSTTGGVMSWGGPHANIAGDTFTGAVTFNSGVTISSGNLIMPITSTFGPSGAYTIQFSGGECNFGNIGNNDAIVHNFVSLNQSQSNGTTHEDFKHSVTFNPTSGASPFVGMSLAYTINQTGTASGGYTAFKVNVTETAVLGPTRLLADLQNGGTSQFNVDNGGNVTFAGTLLTCSSNFTIRSANSGRMYLSGIGVFFRSDNMLGFSSTTTPSGASDLGMARNASGILEVNNGTMGTFAQLKVSALTPSGLTGATATNRCVGAVASGTPASGTFSTGDWCIDIANGRIHTCTAGGTPGTWS